MIDWSIAACYGQDPEYWWPAPGAVDRHATEQAIRICGGCPIRRDCLEYAIALPEMDGIWGGLTATQRALIVEGRRAGAAAAA